jgi:hypothetical protein
MNHEYDEENSAKTPESRVDEMYEIDVMLSSRQCRNNIEHCVALGKSATARQTNTSHTRNS